MQKIDDLSGKIKIGLVAASALVLLLYIVDVLSLSFLINYGLVLLGATVAILLAGALLNFKEQPAKGKSFLIGLAALIVVFFISYAASSSSLNESTGEVIAGSKLSQAGIYTFYVVIVAAIGTIVFSSLKRAFN